MEDALRLALVGNPNSGKSSLFNALTGSRQKVGNYPGVTVERRAGLLTAPDGRSIEIVDLPGTYSLTPNSPDEVVTHDALMGTSQIEQAPEAVVCVVDATNLRLHVRFVLELKRLGIPIVIALNMMDLAARDGIEIDPGLLSKELGLPVIPTVAVRRSGVKDLVESLNAEVWKKLWADYPAPVRATDAPPSVRSLQKEARRIASIATVKEGVENVLTRRTDAVVLHPVIGPVILLSVLFVMFQAVFAWAEQPMEWIDAGVVGLQQIAVQSLPDGLFRSLVVDGILAGVGSVVIFLPQILILFAFIIVLEASGYMARAAFLMDRLMTLAGLNGRAFIPLLSSFACAIPGIMAARTIDNPRDRLTTIMVAPLMTCAARLPVYTLIIAAFIPNTTVFGGVGLQGLVMFGLYLAGIVSALIVAGVLKRTLTKGAPPRLLLELPKYQVPHVRDLFIGLVERARLFLRRAGTIILFSMILLWGLASFPAPPPNATEPDIFYSAAGKVGRALEVVFAPIGFNWEISVALVPGMAAREVAVGALGTVYSLSGSEDAVASSLATVLQSAWSLPTALAFLAWYVFAPQCLSTLAVARRETNSWGWTVFMFGYLFTLAYLAAGATYWISRALI
ncbi:MAG: ferrous iron transporter B [Rhodospirillaceae bacterium]